MTGQTITVYRTTGSVTYSGAENVQNSLNTNHPAGVKLNTDDLFVSYCVPASKASGHTLKGYQMVLAISAPAAALDDELYANLRESGSQTAATFKTFDACHDTIDTTYSKLMKDLGSTRTVTS